jgi:hypothetical protein
MLDLLRFMKVDTQCFDTALLDRRRSQPLEQNDMHKFKGLTTTIQ